MVMGARGVLGKIPLPDAVEAAEDVERPPPRKVRRIWLKLLLAFEVEAEAAEAAAFVDICCGASEGERKRLGSIMPLPRYQPESATELLQRGVVLPA